MAQQLRLHTALTNDSSSVFNTYFRRLTTACSLAARESETSAPLQANVLVCENTQTLKTHNLK